MTEKERFVIEYYPYAHKAASVLGIPVLFALAQSGLESGWGKSIKGNMLFGIKKGRGINYGGWRGDTQLVTTTEYGNTPSLRFPYIYTGYPKVLSNGKWKYRVKDHFRAYPSAYASFLDWGGLLLRNKRYYSALQYPKDPYRFASEIAKAGYATDPNYADKLKRIIKEVEQIVVLHKLNRNKKIPIVLLGGMLLGIALIVGVVLKQRPKYGL